MSKQVQIKKSEIPSDWSIESADFINKCLQRKPANRLGLRGITEAKEHPWFKNYPWKELYEKKIESPFFPKATDNYDKKYCEQVEKIGLDTKERYEAYMHDDEFPQVFRKFTFVDYDELFEKKNEKENKSNYSKVDANKREFSKSALGHSSNTNNSLIKPKNIATGNNPNVMINKSDINKILLQNDANNKYIMDQRSSSTNKLYYSIKAPTKDNEENSSNKQKILQPNNDLTKSAIFKKVDNVLDFNRDKSSNVEKNKKIIDMTSSMIYNDKNKQVQLGNRTNLNMGVNSMNTNLIKSISNNNIKDTSSKNTKIEFNSNQYNSNSNISELIKSNTNNVNSKLPEIESKLERMKKISAGSMISTQLYSARGSSALSSNKSNLDNKKLNQTKIVNSGYLVDSSIGVKKLISNDKFDKFTNYSSMNNKRDASPYISHRDLKK